MKPRPRQRSPVASRQPFGFALLAVLWVIVGLTALGLAASLAARESVAAARNRVELARAIWWAEGCVERARAAAAEALASPRGDAAWGALDSAVAASPLIAYERCTLTVRAAGAALNVNSADEERLRALFTALGLPEARVDSLVDALLDWRDRDGVIRPHGAERAWYDSARRFPPRDGHFADPRELRRVRGLESFSGLDSLLGVEPGRTPLERASIPVIASLPGFGMEATARVAERRLAGAPVGELLTFAEALSRPARDALLARYADASPLASAAPDAWIITAAAARGVPAVTATLEVRVVRAGSRAAVVRQRSMP